MSHTCFHHPQVFELVPLEVTPPRLSAANAFTIKTRQKEDGDWQYLLLVYAAPEVQEFYRTGALSGFYVHALAIGSAASRSLPGLPAFAVLGVELRDGRQINTIPRELVRARRYC